MAAAADEALPELDFFAFDSVSVAGREVNLLRHGMAGEPGFEFWGPWTDREAVESAVLEAGEAYDLRRLGAKSYGSSAVVSGWVGMPLPAIYDGPTMAEYREWLDGTGLEANYSLAGSFDSDDITDYYLTPVELGYGGLVDLDGDFVGKEAIREEIDDPDRTLVTLEWNDEDVVDAFASLFGEGPTAKFVDMPIPWRSGAHVDAVRDGEEVVGVSLWAAYTYNERAMLSLAVLNVALSDPGTEVTLVWGDPDGGGTGASERHEPTEIRATVAPVPYTEDRR
jgi:glycine cleavage system aminomethyltransferase T